MDAESGNDVKDDLTYESWHDWWGWRNDSKDESMHI